MYREIDKRYKRIESLETHFVEKRLFMIFALASRDLDLHGLMRVID